MSDRKPDPRSGLNATDDWVPAFEGQRAPFVPGNELAIRHGAHVSSLRLAPRTAELADEIRAVVPCYTAADETLVRTLALTLARIERAAAALDAIDEAAEENALKAYLGESAPALAKLRDDLRAWLGLSRRILNDLGLSPLARARLSLDVSRASETLEAYLAEHYPVGDAA